MNKIEESVQAFNEGYCCSQAILSIYGESLNLNRELALKISVPFCGGMGIKLNDPKIIFIRATIESMAERPELPPIA